MRSATLDSGLIFYTTLFLVSSHLARTSPRWWVGFSCWLGSLQKAPVILLVWIIILALRFFDHEGRATLRNRWLLPVLPVTLVVMALWPLSQILIFRLSPADVFRIHEPFAIAARRAGAPLLDAPYRLITAWPCGGFAILAAMFTPIIAKGAPRAAAIELASLCLIAIGLSVISNTREVNYLGPIIPSLCVLLALSLRWLLERRLNIGIALSIVIGALAICGWPVMHVWMERTRCQQRKSSGARDLADHAQIAQQLAISQNGNRRRVVVEADNHMLPQDFYLFYGQLDSPLTNLTLDQLQQQRPASPFVAISTKQDMKAAEKLLGHLRLQRSVGEVACWEAD